LTPEDILSAYDEVAKLYANIPSLCIWRTWELAAYRRYQLKEPVLDVGCGDGRFFGLVWPGIQEVVGIDHDPNVVEIARKSGVYKDVLFASISEFWFPPRSFSTVFANCSLEHVDHLSDVLDNLYRALRPRGTFFLSVVTGKFRDWYMLPLLVQQIGAPLLAMSLEKEYEAYHHLTNCLSEDQWVECLKRAGFDVKEHIAILPEMCSRLFLFLDHLWHIPWIKGEIGDFLYPFFCKIPDFSTSLRLILAGFLKMEKDWSTGSGAIFRTEKKA